MERWFTGAWAGNEQLADQIFDDRFSNNGVVVGPAGPKRNIRNRLTGFPDLASVAEELVPFAIFGIEIPPPIPECPQKVSDTS